MAVADNGDGALASRLRRVNPPVIHLQSTFSGLLPSLLPCLQHLRLAQCYDHLSMCASWASSSRLPAATSRMWSWMRPFSRPRMGGHHHETAGPGAGTADDEAGADSFADGFQGISCPDRTTGLNGAQAMAGKTQSLKKRFECPIRCAQRFLHCFLTDRRTARQRPSAALFRTRVLRAPLRPRFQ
jgi:hypothetical protein